MMQQNGKCCVICTEADRMDNYRLLIEQCRQNDGKAQMQFYKLFYKPVFNSCYRILSDSNEAEEVMQETFLKVFMDTYLLNEDKVVMERILKRIVINRAIDICRKRKMVFVPLEGSRYEYTENESYDEDVFFNMEIKTVYKAIQELPDGYRLILTLHLIEEMSYNEISAQINVSASGVRSQYARARKKLIEKLTVK